MEDKQISLEELEEMIENANQEGLLMCMTDAEVNDITELQSQLSKPFLWNGLLNILESKGFICNEWSNVAQNISKWCMEIF